MASRNLFTEEGRTRFRNFGVRLRSYLIVCLGLGLLAGAFWFLNQTRGEMGALERLYFRQYAKATAMSWVAPARPGKYTLLTSGAIGVTDELVYQVKDEQGLVRTVAVVTRLKSQAIASGGHDNLSVITAQVSIPILRTFLSEKQRL